MNRSERAEQIWPLLTLLAAHRQTLSYDTLGQLIGVPRMGLGQLLEPIQSYCILNRLPPLTSLIVGVDSGVPGEGFIAASDVPNAQATVYRRQWLEQKPPDAAQLQQASERLPSNGRSLAELEAEVARGAV